MVELGVARILPRSAAAICVDELLVLYAVCHLLGLNAQMLWDYQKEIYVRPTESSSRGFVVDNMVAD